VEEEDDLIEGTRERPGDITAFLSTHIVAIDVTVVHLQTASSCSTAARYPGRPVETEELRKRTLYGDRMRAGARLVPFAVDDYGHIGDAGLALLEQLAAHAAETRGSDFRHGRSVADRKGFWMARWQERIAWAVHAGIDRSLQRRLAISRRRLARPGGGLG